MAPVVCVLALFIHSCVGFNTAPGLGFRGSSLSSQRATNSLSRPFSTAKVAPARGVRGVLGLRASTERSEVQTQTEDEEEARREKMEKAQALIAKVRGGDAPEDEEAPAAAAEDDAEELRRQKMEKAQALIAKARGGNSAAQTSSDSAAQEAPKDGPGTHKPKVSTWGVFERPKDISKAYGGGRKVGVDGYKPSKEEEEEKRRATMAKLNQYRKSVGVDRELEERHKEEIKEALEKHEAFMRANSISRAIVALENVTQWTNYKSALGGQVYLNLALAYEASGDRPKAKATYGKLMSNADSAIASKAKELIFGFEAMEFMKVNATFSSKDRKVMSFVLPDVAQYTRKRYDTSFYDPKARRRARARQAAGAGLNGAEDDGAIGVEVDYEGVQAEDANSPDVIIVGSGIAGLSCAAVLGKYGYKVLVLESHYHAGGAAHSFDIKGKKGTYTFDSGPSLYSGLSDDDETMLEQQRCVNPLKQVLDAVGEKVDCIQYDTWGVCLPEGDFPAKVGSEPFIQDLLRLFPGEEGKAAVEEWKKLQAYMAPLAAASVALPPAAIRFDVGILATLFRYLPNMIKYPNLPLLIGPYSKVLENVDLKNKFIRNWLDMLCFLLSGLPADGTITAEVAFMFAEWYRPGVKLDYPKGGSHGIVEALVRGIEKHGGEVRLKAHVDQIMVAGGAAYGVRLKSGERVRAKRMVVSNAAMKSTLRMLPDGALPPAWENDQEETPECPSFMHLHLGFDASGLKEAMGGKDLDCHYMVVNDWERGVDSEQNLVLISIPSVLDPSMAPAGTHALHAYTPATEPYDLWKGLNRSSAEYAKLKEERSQVLWKAVERVIPDIRERVDVELVGTPLTHERFLRRHRGTYGPAIQAGQQIFPGPKTPIKNLLLCGDSVFPGIGMPAVAASGMVAAHTMGLETLSKQQKLLDDLKI